MDRREAIVAIAGIGIGVGELKSRLEKLRRGCEKMYSPCWLTPNEMRAASGRTKWRIVDQMIEEQGGEV